MRWLEGLAHIPVSGAKVLNLVTALTYLYRRNTPAAIIFNKDTIFLFLSLV